MIAPLFFAMRRKSCIFVAKYAENNSRFICKKTDGYVFMEISFLVGSMMRTFLLNNLFGF